MIPEKPITPLIFNPPVVKFSTLDNPPNFKDIKDMFQSSQMRIGNFDVGVRFTSAPSKSQTQSSFSVEKSSYIGKVDFFHSIILRYYTPGIKARQ